MSIQHFSRVESIEAILYDGTNINEIDEFINLDGKEVKAFLYDDTNIVRYLSGIDGKVVESRNIKGTQYCRYKIPCSVGLVNLYVGQYVVRWRGGCYVWDKDVLCDTWRLDNLSKRSWTCKI